MQRARETNLGFESRKLFVAGLNIGALQLKPDHGRDAASARLILAATLGCLIPARRAARIDPITPIRHE
jgi:ABC-type lipoprotein release transport system permease subunit